MHMDDAPPSSLDEPLPVGRQAWQQALREGLAAPGPAWCMYSPDYADWPLHEVAVVDALRAWAVGRRRPCVRMLGRDFDALIRFAPRFVAWRRQFGHLIECRALPETVAAPDECLLLDGRGWIAKPVQRGRAGLRCSARGWRLAGERFDAAWGDAHPAFAPDVVGL